MTPPISTHHVLATELFDTHGVVPARRVEADHEAVINSLVAAGLGVALMREDLALADAARGELVIWGESRIATRLQFVYPKEREREPAIHALSDVVADVWRTGDGSRAADRPSPRGP